MTRSNVPMRGLIPTYAGNTIICVMCVCASWAHPHVCGEHRIIPLTEHRDWGSSPRMRGTLRAANIQTEKLGLIPTYAGNTELFFYSAEGVGAHPHVCGEHQLQPPKVSVHVGSSPRMRGTHRIRATYRLLAGLIPTYAGNTTSPVKT